MRNGYTSGRGDWRADNSYSRGSSGGFGGRGYTHSTGYSSMGGSFQRNRNTVRHTVKGLGKMTSVFVVIGLVFVMSVLYLQTGTRATSYDYALNDIENEIEDLQSKRDDLAVEKARLQSIAQSEKSTVAARMANANDAEYAVSE